MAWYYRTSLEVTLVVVLVLLLSATILVPLRIVAAECSLVDPHSLPQSPPRLTLLLIESTCPLADSNVDPSIPGTGPGAK